MSEALVGLRPTKDAGTNFHAQTEPEDLPQTGDGRTLRWQASITNCSYKWWKGSVNSNYSAPLNIHTLVLTFDVPCAYNKCTTDCCLRDHKTNNYLVFFLCRFSYTHLTGVCPAPPPQPYPLLVSQYLPQTLTSLC